MSATVIGFLYKTSVLFKPRVDAVLRFPTSIRFVREAPAAAHADRFDITALCTTLSVSRQDQAWSSQNRRALPR